MNAKALFACLDIAGTQTTNWHYHHGNVAMDCKTRSLSVFQEAWSDTVEEEHPTVPEDKPGLQDVLGPMWQPFSSLFPASIKVL